MTTELSGVDLARQALVTAREAAEEERLRHQEVEAAHHHRHVPGRA
ncbi:hypothetical protein [Streptomyces sp. ITFR-6]|nr:hypothetical protein [Streptomyces sp. ITFR-6]WNI34412.1 hypothetical protein RLT59_37980 [Streptomyces sp. ITFR-6]